MINVAHSQAHSARQSLHLHIDPSPYRSQVQLSPNASPYASENSDYILFSVLCLYDFSTSDPDHLPFRKNEILEIVKQEETGWWAAMRKEVEIVGWIPQAFVVPLTVDMAERLRGVREDLRNYEYEAEQLYNVPIAKDYAFGRDRNPPHLRIRTEDEIHDHKRPLSSDMQPVSVQTPPSPATPMPYPPKRSAQMNKPTPPTPNSDSDRVVFIGHSRNLSEINRLHGRPSKISANDDHPSATYITSDTITTWFRPRHSDQLEIDNEGHIRTGTVVALVEKLVLDFFRKDSTNTLFQNIFFTTFRTFMTADRLFYMLVEMFCSIPPPSLNDDEIDEWRSRWLLPIQRHVLTLFTIWLEDHRLLEEEPHIANSLTGFLQNTVTPPHAVAAKLIVKSIERLTFASPISASPAVSPRKARKSKAYKNDLLKIEYEDLAEQLSLMEFQLYAKIAPQECLTFAKCQTDPGVANLSAFCATYDKLSTWVKASILENDTLGKRAETVDFWIRVAEKCRVLNNFSSMSAVTAALSSTVIARLHFTLSHIKRKSVLEALIRLNDPTGRFAAYRNLLNNVEGPCVPFITMLLTDLTRIQEQHTDTKDRICFLQRQKWYETVSAILRCQSRPYDFALSESTISFIHAHLREVSVRQPQWFWTRSHDIQNIELAHADIRKGLEQAGF